MGWIAPIYICLFTCHRCCSDSRCAAVCLWSSWSSGPTLSQPRGADSISYKVEPNPSWPPYALATGKIRKHRHRFKSEKLFLTSSRMKNIVISAALSYDVLVSPFCPRSYPVQSPTADHQLSWGLSSQHLLWWQWHHDGWLPLGHGTELSDTLIGQWKDMGEGRQ